jgi:transposase
LSGELQALRSRKIKNAYTAFKVAKFALKNSVLECLHCAIFWSMAVKLQGLDIDKVVAELEAILASEKDVPVGMRKPIEALILVVKLLTQRVGLTSRNSSKPPSSDPNRPKSSRPKSNRTSGGQPGRVGTTLKPVETPDEITVLKIDRRTLPRGSYTVVGCEKRQVFDLHITRHVIEYQAQILEDAQGRRFVATFPEGVQRPAQYGNGLKAHAVYLSQHQLLPYKRVQEYFSEQLQIPLSEGSLFNFNQEASERLTLFSHIASQKLAHGSLLHVDETGVNINGTRHWLHCASNALWTDFSIHAKRGVEAMNARGILPCFGGVLCHDHWKPYYRYTDCTHALCNAHHLRELVRAHEQDGQAWALDMKMLLEEINKATQAAGGCLKAGEAQAYRLRYRALLAEADIECPPPDEKREPGQRGKVKKSKARNLLERLRNFEADTLRFMDNPEVPFTNNQGENDIRMTKVQQKISGCFRSTEGAEIFCRVRSYLSTCRKHGVSSSQAMTLLFKGELPDFAR